MASNINKQVEDQQGKDGAKANQSQLGHETVDQTLPKVSKNNDTDINEDDKDIVSNEGSVTEATDESSCDSWYYDIYDLEEASKYPSQPCSNIRGVSYTPPGWRRVYKKRPKDDESKDGDTPCAKRLKM